MPERVLNGDRPDDRPAAGFFGKLPSTGDFVARGLPDGFRRRWDGWVTRHLAPRQRDGAAWPEGGVRFRLRSGGVDAAGVILPGRDSAGRAFPLTLVLIGALPGPAALDPWCDAALRAAARADAADDLWRALEGLDPPQQRTDPALPSLLLWSAQTAPAAAPPDDPGPALDRLLVSSG